MTGGWSVSKSHPIPSVCRRPPTLPHKLPWFWNNLEQFLVFGEMIQPICCPIPESDTLFTPSSNPHISTFVPVFVVVL